ncbi:MAG: hypothetical protein M3Y28_03275 [Armatimonadota bacterium]|nr:hypothetical protein [Armatimonadota bacterium]
MAFRGALLILTAFALSQLKRLDQNLVAYLLLNLIGSLILAVLAAIEHQWGFLLLEGAWAIVSLASLVPSWPVVDGRSGGVPLGDG